MVVLIASFPYAHAWTAEHVPAIVHLTHNSQELGNALADVLLRRLQPGRPARRRPGRARSTDLPPMMDYDIRHGRTYLYFEGEPLYPFGYGLSYTTFAYSGLTTSAKQLEPDAPIDVSVDVTNTGARAGDEVVQLYVRYPESKVPRPLKQLRGFQRVEIASGATRTVTLKLAAEDLAYWSPEKHAWVVEPGRVELQVGPSSADADLKLRTTVAVAP